MLSVYKLLKPPKFGNCTVLADSENAHRPLGFDEFKAIFTCEEKSRATHLQQIKDKLNDLSDTDDWDYDLTRKDHELFEYIIYYLTGFICKKSQQGIKLRSLQKKIRYKESFNFASNCRPCNY